MAPGPIPPTPGKPGRRHVTFSPTQLRVFRNCPERYYRQYIANERVTQEFNRATLRGSAVHKVLATIFTARQDGEILDEDHRPLAEQFLPFRIYQKAASTADWPDDVDWVLRLVANGLARVPADAEVIAVERSFKHVLHTGSLASGATLVGKVDLLIRHSQGILEHIEFKTGGARSDPFQEVICRIGVCVEYLVHGLPILSTTYQLSSGSEDCLDGDRAVLRAVLTEIENTIEEIWNATSWDARENDSCGICNYRTSLCSVHGEWSRPNRLERNA